MDFFEAQEKAVVRSRYLLVLFLAAVLSMIAVVYVAVILVMGIGLGGVPGGWLDPTLLAGVAGGMTLLIGTGAAVRTAQLRKGGAVVAELLGGSRVRPDTADPAERRLLNVVEEMSIASGVPVPAVFVMQNETGINAFAAGHTIHDAAVSVTRGTLESLSRDELQGVVAHEFSHILNGDMRLNVRLMGLLFGILLLTIVGRIVVRTRGGRRGKGAQIVLLGLVLIVLGYLGVFFGRLIQSAVSRQREFLADASAVQFTRARDGIAGALKKIGGWRGSRVQNAHAAEAGHFFFAQGIGRAMAGALATHPPLEERIRRIDPTWDGVFLELAVGEPEVGRGKVAAPTAPLNAPARTVGLAAAMAPGARPTLPEVVASVGTIGSAALGYARSFVERLPPAVLGAARTSTGAGDVVCALLLSADPEVRDRQLQIVASARTGPGAERALAIWEAVYDLGAEARLPLLDLALPALREVSAGEAAALQITVPRLIRVDGRVLPFEFALFHILRRHLPGSREAGRRRGHLPLAQLRREARIVLSVVARAGSLPQDGPDAEMELGLEQVDAALERLALGAPMARKEILEAALASALGDGMFRPAEIEVVRAIAEALELPLPPVLMGTAA